MKCEDVRELLGSFIDDELPVEVIARINGHIVDCLECQDERTALTMVRSHVHDYGRALDPPNGFVERLKQGVDARLRVQQAPKPKFQKSWYMVPLAAGVAVAIFSFHRPEQLKAILTAPTTHTMALSAQEIYSYEHNIKNSKLQPVEYNPRLAARVTGFVAEPPQFQGWSLAKTFVVSVNSTKAIKYSYRQNDHGNIKTMACYQFPGGVFDASGLSHHVIDGRSICCGAKDNISLVYWKNTNKDFVLVSDELPRTDLLSIALNS